MANKPRTVVNESAIKIAEERDKLRESFERQSAENARLRAELLERETELKICRASLAELQTSHEELRKRCEAIVAAGVPDSQWREVGISFGALLKVSLDPARLVGLEVEVEGKSYLIGDVHPEGGQFGRTNLAFPHSAVVTRARVRVKK